ncbi:MAG: bifunctional diaminohydroxyphosphoribosylaminopyrimidine deaminase/5-amino-6-(5-phosphoribosylamino)uracil reductase RibD [Beijerinckiaceae bacterium]|nr:bifunctional diaminohydroxyphosphoribosylaminopyrimidine deaminase/5-amino-6-(5-phosphoribosylamino)uracil reductase RibD [Beijerinckiaceae bacterium]
MSATDEAFMAAALAIGRRGMGRVAPNPAVGALVVKDGIVVGRGVTAPGGRPHAETIALAQAGDLARGATIYVTLEPCSHHGVTGPCCEAVVAAGVTRLVYAIGDANPLVAGRGAAYCREHGLEVVAGVGAKAAARDHRGHLLRMTRQRPMVTLKLAETADGYVAGGRHDPRLAITGVAVNGIVHVWRAMHDAIMVGIGTALADDPLMTVRLPGVAAKPLRVVLDARAQLPTNSRLVQTAQDAPVLVLVGADAPADALSAARGVEVATVATTPDGRLDLAAALNLLAARGITRVFSEGGPAIAEQLIAGGLADDVAIFTAQKPLGHDGVPTLAAAARATLTAPAHYRLVEDREVGPDRLRLHERIA